MFQNMNFIYLFIVFLSFSCKQKIDFLKKTDGYSVEEKGLDSLSVFYTENGLKKNVDLLKINSDKFKTYVPILWELKIVSDTLLVVVDTLDNKGDNIVINIRGSSSCNIENVSRLREYEFIDNNYKILSSESIFTNLNKHRVNIHKNIIGLDKNKFKEKCYHICKSPTEIVSCCLTSSLDDETNREVVLDLVARQLILNLDD